MTPAKMTFGRFRVVVVLSALISVSIGCQEEDGSALRLIVNDAIAGDSAFAPCATPDDADRATRELLSLVNRERQRRGLDPLKRDTTLDKIADFYACRLIDGGFFSHRDPFDKSRIDSRAQDFGYAFQKIGENLAAGQMSVDQVMREWMESTGHRENILDPVYTEIGLSVRVGGKHGIYWVQEFGRPLDARPIDLVADAGEQSEDKSGGAGSPPSESPIPFGDLYSEFEYYFD